MANVGKEGDDTPTLGDLLASSNETKEEVRGYLNQTEITQERMLRVMENLEGVNQRGAPLLNATIGEGDERAVMSTIPYVAAKPHEPKDETSRLLAALNTPLVPMFDVEVGYLMATRYGFLMLTDLYLMKFSLEKEEIIALQSPFNNGQNRRVDYPVWLRKNSDSSGRLQDVKIQYEVLDGGGVCGEVKFGELWKGHNDERFSRDRKHVLWPVDPDEAIVMLIETQEIYTEALSQVTNKKRALAQAAEKLLGHVKEKRKRG